MSARSKKDQIADFLDIRGTARSRNGVKDYLKDLSKAPAPKQIAVGAISGWCAGYLFVKVGKIAAVSIGGSLLLLQIASHQGYIKVNWNKVNSHVEQATREISKEAQQNMSKIARETKRFIKDNAVVATGFAGGFLLGVASS